MTAFALGLLNGMGEDSVSASWNLPLILKTVQESTKDDNAANLSTLLQELTSSSFNYTILLRENLNTIL